LVICTFTEKAAFELRDRISAAARKVGYSGDLTELRVSTIHSLCHRLLAVHRHRNSWGTCPRQYQFFREYDFTPCAPP
ncbi:MAG: UvrD-helicase domain-containing protein, partial [Planctomycetota bacterium]